MFELPELPYDHAALEPVISRDTMHLHHGKHHKAYVDTMNRLMGELGVSADTVEEVVRLSAGDAKKRKLFNAAAQTWNHTFFWMAMSPRRQTPSGQLAAAIDKTFGGIEKLKSAFVAEGVGHFGSGWVWLAAQGEDLKILSTHDAEDLLVHDGLTPLLVCDVWEHAYYLDHKNDRKAFLEAWFDALPNWAFAADQYQAAGSDAVWKHPAAVEENAKGTAASGAR